MLIRLYGVVNDSIVDGPGLRYAIFAQGCPHRCEGCHNPQSHDMNGGYEVDTSVLLAEIDQNPLLDGVTFTGGEPFMQPEPFIELAREVKKRKLHLMVYSGYTFEEILSLGQKHRELLSYCDTMVDGRFVLALRSLDLLYKGSSNQRIIQVQESLQQNSIVLQQVNEYGELI